MKELIYGFYSKKHFISFIIYIVFCLILDAIMAALLFINGIEGLLTLLPFFIVLLEMAIGIAWLPFPVYFIERRFNKKRDYIQLKNSFEVIISNNLHSETKNYVRMVLLRYSIMFDLPYANGLLKEIHFPQKSNEILNVTYFQAMFEYYIANGSHTKAKNILDAMAEYKVSKNIFYKYFALYSIYVKNEVSKGDLMFLNPTSKDFLDRILSQFGLALYAKDNKDKEKYELYKKNINKSCPNNPYFRQLTK